MLGASLVLREITGAFDLRRGAVLNIWHFNSCRSHLDNSETQQISHHHQGNMGICRMLNCKGLQFPTLMGILIPFSSSLLFSLHFLNPFLCLFCIFFIPLLSFFSLCQSSLLPLFALISPLRGRVDSEGKQASIKMLTHTYYPTTDTHIQTAVSLTLTHT